MGHFNITAKMIPNTSTRLPPGMTMARSRRIAAFVRDSIALISSLFFASPRTTCRANIPPTIITTDRICKSLKKLYQLMLSPQFIVEPCRSKKLAQRQLDRSFHGHRSPLRPKRVKLLLSEHCVQLCDRLIVFDPLLFCHRCLDLSTQSFCCSEQFDR